MRRWQPLLVLLLSLCVALTLAGCGKKDAAADDSAGARSGGPSADGKAGDGKAANSGGSRRGGRPSGGGSRGGGPPGGGGFGGFGEPQTAVPVEVTAVVRRSISSFLETNGTLEAENDVDLIARTSGPIVELKVEEGMRVKAGQLLARIDPDEVRARMEIARVNRDEAKLAYERARSLRESELLSQEAYDQARSTYESAEAQLLGEQIVLGYTEVKAPFNGVISGRYVKLAQYVGLNDPLFRVTSFDPLLCPIRVPERELPRLTVGQPAHVAVEAWAGERFPARVLRISPVVDAATGTVKVTLEVAAGGKLRPGMFASVFLETERRDDALVIPKAALSLESIGDTVYVAAGETASRREVRLGFQEGDFVEVAEGVAEGENVIVVGQDGLSDGTPIQVLAGAGQPAAPAAEARPAAGSPAGPEAAAAGPGQGGGPPRWGGAGGPGFDPSNMTPEQIETVKQRMRERGMSDEQIAERLKRMKERAGGGNPP